MWRVWIAVAVVAILLVFPTVAFAHDNVPVTCSLTLGVLDPGTVAVDENEVKTLGEVTRGALNCNVDALDGVFGTVHDSEITMKLDGSFSGEMEGTFTLETVGGTLTGKFEADISGVMVQFAPSPPFPPGTPVYNVTDVGKWELDSGDVEAEGTVTIALVGVIGLPATLGGLAGFGGLDGELEGEDYD